MKSIYGLALILALTCRTSSACGETSVWATDFLVNDCEISAIYGSSRGFTSASTESFEGVNDAAYATGNTIKGSRCCFTASNSADNNGGLGSGVPLFAATATASQTIIGATPATPKASIATQHLVTELSTVNAASGQRHERATTPLMTTSLITSLL